MKVRARRGVCIGVDRHMQPGDTEDLDAAQVTFLVGIGAVELVPDEVVVEQPDVEQPDVEQPDVEQPEQPELIPAEETESKSTPEKSGKKEK